MDEEGPQTLDYATPNPPRRRGRFAAGLLAHVFASYAALSLADETAELTSPSSARSNMAIGVLVLVVAPLYTPVVLLVALVVEMGLGAPSSRSPPLILVLFQLLYLAAFVTAYRRLRRPGTIGRA